MSLLKQLKWNLILLAVIFIALGIVLILAGGNDENDLLSAGGDAFGIRSGFPY